MRSGATGLDYAINRFYDSKQGRFTQVDPVGVEAVDLLDTQQLNMYVYARNDPINNTDPLGLDWIIVKEYYTVSSEGDFYIEDGVLNEERHIEERTRYVVQWVDDPTYGGGAAGRRASRSEGKGANNETLPQPKTPKTQPTTSKCLGSGFTLNASINACGGPCVIALDLSTGIMNDCRGLSVFGAVGGALFGLTMGRDGFRPSAGLSASAGVNLGYVYTTGGNSTGWASTLTGGLGAGNANFSVSADQSWSSNVSLGLSVGGGIATYNTYTWASSPTKVSNYIPSTHYWHYFLRP
jgi:RHS repeat-associated protein